MGVAVVGVVAGERRGVEVKDTSSPAAPDEGQKAKVRCHITLVWWLWQYASSQLPELTCMCEVVLMSVVCFSQCF